MPYVELSKDDIGIKSKLMTAGRILYSFEAKKRLSKLLDKYPVDIAHLHNIYHHISPSILYVLKKRKIPVVMTLHDYKMVCASYHLQAHGKPCEACSGGRYFMATKNMCVKESFAKSTLNALEMYLHHKIFNIYDNVDVFISPSRFLKDKLLEMGFKKEIQYLPNYIDIEKFRIFGEDGEDGKVEKENSIVYFGRLSQEKGLFTLIDAVKILKAKNMNAIKVKIIGSGPIKDLLESRVRSAGLTNIQFLGYKTGEELKDEIRKSMFVVLPSDCYENNPLTVLETFALGKPVIGSRIGGIPEIIENNVTGLTFEVGNAEDMCLKIEYLISHKDKRIEMGKNAIKFVEQELSIDNYYKRLMEIYQQALNHKF
jgi:glycosyltransferase involved in cell wall biosynthesis